MRYTLFALLLIGLCSGTAAAQMDSQMARADSLFDNYEEEQALEAYEEVLRDEPENLKALWHSSLLYSRVGNRFDEEQKEKEYYNLGRKRAEQALDVDPDDTNANFVMAVAMGRMALIAGSKERVAASRDIKKYADRSIEADSANPGPWHVLGRWNYEISDLNFAERLAANVLFGGIPDGASTENAVEYINKAIELNPKFVLYYYDLAKAYERLGEEEKAIAACKTGLEKPTLATDDEKVKEDCRALVDELE
jgi:tetratricopeptide (TPR) repeat protein